MSAKRKPTFEQALGLQRGQAAARAAARRRASQRRPVEHDETAERCMCVSCVDGRLRDAASGR